jgi:signal transduction histidine kinase
VTERERAQVELRQNSEELIQTLQELKQAQLQIVQNEKMATLGNLVAGVAHEINNPLGFLVGSLGNTEEYLQDIFAHIECYQQIYPDPDPAVIHHQEEVDLEYLMADLPKVIESMKIATARIQGISNSLRIFSRADTAEKIACNIHEGIESTLLILKYRLKGNEQRPEIQVIKQYGQIPPVRCFLGQLNQVFMNILANAIDALNISSQERTFAENQAHPLKIVIRTEVLTEQGAVTIRIQDNGPGIPETVKAHIFEHLFTTKQVGTGTGLGLAIARQVVEEVHGGKLLCNSVVGKGTEFIVEIPES